LTTHLAAYQLAGALIASLSGCTDLATPRLAIVRYWSWAGRPLPGLAWRLRQDRQLPTKYVGQARSLGSRAIHYDHHKESS